MVTTIWGCPDYIEGMPFLGLRLPLFVLAITAGGCSSSLYSPADRPSYDPPPAPPALAVLYADGTISAARSSVGIIAAFRDTTIVGVAFRCRQVDPVSGRYHAPWYLGALVSAQVTLDVRDAAGTKLAAVSLVLDRPASDSTGWVEVQIARADPFPALRGAEPRAFPLEVGGGAGDSLWVRWYRRATAPLFGACG